MLFQLRPGLGFKLVVELHLIVLRVVSEDNHFIFELLQALLVVDPNKDLELPAPKQFLTWLGQQEPESLAPAVASTSFKVSIWAFLTTRIPSSPAWFWIDIIFTTSPDFRYRSS